MRKCRLADGPRPPQERPAMTFTTLTFFVFLAVVFTAYWAIGRRRAQNALIVAASCFFYAWWDYRFCALMLATSLVDFAVGLALERTARPAYRRGLLALSCCFSLGLLAFFKYCNFFAENLRTAAAALGWHIDLPTLNVILPAGISFYTFQTLSYVIDVYRREMRASRSVIDYLAFVTFFPQLVAGPIERAPNMLPQFERPRTFDYAASVEGCRLILWGCFKKLALADNLAGFVDRCYSAPTKFDGPHLAIATVFFAFQIYCDFSAYSDIALGTGRLFGITLMRNFARPYFARSPAEFWRRWHISLSTWFRDYVFIPLGGSRSGKSRIARNLLVTFVISGLWHGANWTFILWGALHGLAVLPSALRSRNAPKQRAGDVPGGLGLVPTVHSAACMLATFAFVCVTWVFFRAASIGDALMILWRMTLGLLTRVPSESFGARNALHMFAALVAFVVFEWFTRGQVQPLRVGRWPVVLRWSLYTAFVWGSFYFMVVDGSGQFIYFQF
jgi:alginate O-acetyltransferase complex protein AlgI